MSQNDPTPSEESARDAEFVPRGALAFVALMLIAYAATWFFFYSVMIGRP